MADSLTTSADAVIQNLAESFVQCAVEAATWKATAQSTQAAYEQLVQQHSQLMALLEEKDRIIGLLNANGLPMEVHSAADDEGETAP
jgi:N-dimethylarginine dimethylaminohydrolase